MATLEKVPYRKKIPIVTVNRHGTILTVNAAFEKAFAWEAKNLSGKMLTTIIPKQLRDAHHLGFSRFLLTGIPTILDQSLDLKILTGEGLVKAARHYITAEQKNGEWFFTAEIVETTQTV